MEVVSAAICVVQLFICRPGVTKLVLCSVWQLDTSLKEVLAHVSGNESHMTESTGVNINKVAINTADSVQDNGHDSHSLSGYTKKTCSEMDSKSCEDPFDCITALFTDCDIVTEIDDDETVLDTSNVQFGIHKLIANLDAAMHYVDLKVQDNQGTIAVI